MAEDNTFLKTDIITSKDFKYVARYIVNYITMFQVCQQFINLLIKFKVKESKSRAVLTKKGNGERKKGAESLRIQYTENFLIKNEQKALNS